MLEKLTGNNSLYTGILETGEVFFPLFKRIHRINVDQLKGFVEVAKQFLCITRFIFQPPLFSCFLLSLFLSQFSSFKVPIWFLSFFIFFSCLSFTETHCWVISYCTELPFQKVVFFLSLHGPMPWPVQRAVTCQNMCLRITSYIRNKAGEWRTVPFSVDGPCFPLIDFLTPISVTTEMQIENYLRSLIH